MTRNKSKTHQWLETIQYRRKLEQGEKRELIQLEKGFKGEVTMDAKVEKFLEKDFVVIDDLTLEYQGVVVQIDKIIIAGNTIYILDMKNYYGGYCLRGNNWYHEGEILTHNILEQLRRAVRLVSKLLKANHIYLEVKGVLAFIAPEGQVTVEDTIPEIVLSYADINLWLNQLNQEKFYSSHRKIEKVFRQYEIEAYPCRYRTQLAELRPGICCPHCHHFHMTETEFTMDCSCGHIEVKAKAYLRTVCEYGVLFPEKNLYRKDLLKFFGEGANLQYLNKILLKYFTPIQISPKRSLGHINKGTSFEYWFKDQTEHWKNLEKRKTWIPRHKSPHH